MSTPTRIVLLRHGVTDWNAEELFQGQSDIPLNDEGILQAQRVAPVIAAMEPSALYSSHLQRARTTAEEIASVSGLNVLIDERLAEIDVGSWAGQKLKDIAATDKAFAEALRNDRDHRRSPEGETCTEVGERIGAALREIIAEHPKETIVVVSHGMAIRMGVASLLGWDYSTAAALAGMGNCSWTVMVERRHRWRIKGYNLHV